MADLNRGTDCAAACEGRACYFLREQEDGRVVAAACRGTCAGKCLGADAPDGTGPELPAAARAAVNTREIGWETLPALKREQYERSCAVACAAAHGDCFGSCVGVCFGLAAVQDVGVAASPSKP